MQLFLVLGFLSGLYILLVLSLCHAVLFAVNPGNADAEDESVVVLRSETTQKLLQDVGSPDVAQFTLEISCSGPCQTQSDSCIYDGALDTNQDRSVEMTCLLSKLEELSRDSLDLFNEAQ